MAGSLNSVQLIGNLGRDPETRSLQNGNKVCNFSVACSERWKGKDGEMQEKTEWVPIVVWGPLADVAEKYLRKGSKVYVRGKFTTRKWEKDGVDRYSTEVVLQGFGAELILLSDKAAGAGGGGGTTSDTGKGTPSQAERDLDDDIPF